MESDLVDFIFGFDILGLAWKAFADRFNKNIGFSSIYLLCSLTDLRMLIDAFL